MPFFLLQSRKLQLEMEKTGRKKFSIFWIRVLYIKKFFLNKTIIKIYSSVKRLCNNIEQCWNWILELVLQIHLRWHTLLNRYCIILGFERVTSCANALRCHLKRKEKKGKLLVSFIPLTKVWSWTHIKEYNALCWNTEEIIGCCAVGAVTMIYVYSATLPHFGSLPFGVEIKD